MESMAQGKQDLENFDTQMLNSDGFNKVQTKEYLVSSKVELRYKICKIKKLLETLFFLLYVQNFYVWLTKMIGPMI